MARKTEKLALISALMDRIHHEDDVIAEIFSEQCAVIAKQDIINRAIQHGDDNDYGFSTIEDEYVSLMFEQTASGFTVKNVAGDSYVFELVKVTRVD